MFDDNGLPTTPSISRLLSKLRSGEPEVDLKKQPKFIKLLICVPRGQEKLYRQDELYNPNFVNRHPELVITVQGKEYVAVEEIFVDNWAEAVQVEFLTRSSPWMAVMSNSIHEYTD